MIFRGGQAYLGRMVTVNRGLTESVFMPALVNRIKKQKERKKPRISSASPSTAPTILHVNLNSNMLSKYETTV